MDNQAVVPSCRHGLFKGLLSAWNLGLDLLDSGHDGGQTE